MPIVARVLIVIQKINTILLDGVDTFGAGSGVFSTISLSGRAFSRSISLLLRLSWSEDIVRSWELNSATMRDSRFLNCSVLEVAMLSSLVDHVWSDRMNQRAVGARAISGSEPPWARSFLHTETCYANVSTR